MGKKLGRGYKSFLRLQKRRRRLLYHHKEWSDLYSTGSELLEQYEEGGNPVHLFDAINNLQKALNLRPRGDSDRSHTLDTLGSALLARYEREGNMDDVVQAIAYHQEDLVLCPLGHPDHPMSLNNLATALMTRYEQEGGEADLVQVVQLNQRALDLRPPGHPDRSMSLNNLANALLTRYELEGEIEDLVQVIQLNQQALDLRPPGHPNRSSTLNNLADALITRYEQEGELEDLVQVIQLNQQALDLRPPGHPDRSGTLNNLANALQTRYEREGELADLVQAVQLHQQALDLCPPGHPDRSMSLSNLADALLKRYQHEGELADLVQVVQLSQQALDLRPPGHPDRSMSLSNLANALLTRYEREGELAGLVQVIQLDQQALDLCPPGHPDHSMSLSNLANALQTRYEREGELEDLVQVIQLHQQAFDLCPPGHPDRYISLTNLANALMNRYEQEGESADLVQVIQLNQQALDLCPPGHPDRSMSFGNLANALLTRYEHEGELGDLVQVIQLNQQALDLRPPGHPDRSMSLKHLADAFLTRYEHEGGLEDLVQVVQLHQQALDLRPPGHPDRSTSLRSLANALLLRYKGLHRTDHPDRGSPLNLGTGAEKALNRAEPTSDDSHSPTSLIATIVALLREASESSNCSPRDCLKAALRWITVSKEVDPDSTLDAYISALQQLDIVLAFGQSLDKRHDRFLSDDLVWETDGLGDEAATWALQRGEFQRAVELLEQGRTLLLAQVGRYRVEHDDLRQADTDLADRFSRLSRQLDASVVSDKQIEDRRSTSNDQYGRYRNLSMDWDQIVGQIRALPGFDTFLKPMPYDRLRNAAAVGPIVIVIPNESNADALIVSGNSPILHIHLPLAASDRLAELSETFTHSIDRTDFATEKMCIAALKSLWKWVVGPIAQALQNDLNIQIGSRIWWCPTSVASSLPLHAAGLYSERHRTENFLDLYISSYTSTVQALLRARRHANTSAPKNVLVVSQPNTPGEQPLECAAEEAGVITSIVSPIMEVKVLSGEAGRRIDVQRAMESHPWVHFICHGVQVDGQPFDSYLSLHDGHLTLRNIIERNLPNADFAFLAACHSAAGDEDLANEVLHLASAMQFAGFRGVVGTLWEMADEDGPPLAEVFYREMVQRGDSRGAAAALSEAIKSLRRNGVPVNRWMRFVHIGI